MTDQVLLTAACGLLGLMIGSFLNVVVHRVPLGLSVVSPPSACPGCSTPISPRDNIPVVSWLVLRGRCRTCARPISARYPLVEAATAVSFGVVAWLVGWNAMLPAWLYFAALAIALSLIDIDHHRLPDRLVLPSYPVVALLLSAAAWAQGDWLDFQRALFGGLALFAFYFALAFVYPAGMGGGDVKLAGVLGMYLGWLGWELVALGGFLGFFFGAIVGVALMLFRGAGRKARIPFGPFMLAGTATAAVVGQSIVDWYLGTAGLS